MKPTSEEAPDDDSDVIHDRQMAPRSAATSTANRRARSDAQSHSGHGTVNRAFDGCEETFVDVVSDRLGYSDSTTSIARRFSSDASLWNTNSRRASSAQLKRSGALRIKQREGFYGQRRLWFERDWIRDGALPSLRPREPEEEDDFDFNPDAAAADDLGHRGQPPAAVHHHQHQHYRPADPKVGKSSYSIGVFYSDTDRCGHVDPSTTVDKPMVDHVDEMSDAMGPPHAEHRRVSGGGRLNCRRSTTTTTNNSNTQIQDTPQPEQNNNALPDILNSHLPPPYSTLPPSRRLPPPSHPPPPPPPPLCGTATTPGGSGQPPACPHSRRTSRGPRGFRGGGARRTPFPPPAASESDEPKHCCGVMVTQTVSIRWFIVMIAFVGLCCAIVGTVLGALKATGREHLTVSLLMIGVGIVLITVSGIAWRLTSHDAPSCRAMLGLQNSEQEPNRRFVPRVPPYGRPHHPYAAMMYPEFQYRPPPPSYQASMQEYRLRLLLLDRQQGSGSAPSGQSSALSPVSPPPTYRSHTAATAIHSRYLDRPPLTLTEREYSRPPSYRSRAGSAGVLRPSTETLSSSDRAPSLNPQTPSQPPPQHSRQPSLSLSFLSHESLFVDSSHSRAQQDPVHFTSPSAESQNSLVAGLSDDSSPPGHITTTAATTTWRLPPLIATTVGSTTQPCWTRKHPHHHDVNAVTIVQTTDSSQVLNRDTVILSVPGQDAVAPRDAGGGGEVRILAHV